jgi:phosphatidylglycerophosphatase A
LPATWTSIAILFVLFRAFDVVKPFPAGRCETINGGRGIMADDVVAGIYANLAYRILMLMF